MPRRPPAPSSPSSPGPPNDPDTPDAQRDPASLAADIEAWFAAQARALPWREPVRNPYHALVSELMLQQTQVARVIDKFTAFIARFPTIESLANADEHDVLAAWSGLGYYRRARHLHAAARAIVRDHAGRIPAEVDDLLRLPGIGRYTAGAISSIAFGKPAPIVDGNVTRVLVRLHARDEHPTDPDLVNWTWRTAGDLATAAANPAALNEGLMELGATVCTPRAPRCLFCPLRHACAAHRTGRVDELPRPKPSTRQSELFVAVVVLTAPDGSRWMTRRDDAFFASPAVAHSGSKLWLNLWQPPTFERTDRAWKLAELRAQLVHQFPVEHAGSLQRCAPFVHQTTHRLVRFTVYASACARADVEHNGGRWVTPDQLGTLPISAAHTRAIESAG